MESKKVEGDSDEEVVEVVPENKKDQPLS